ncbi:MAG: hypothetical protein JWM02_2284 [Frankiales bacterium]|nr:hypothetical protein [Frankiales bacterium]
MTVRGTGAGAGPSSVMEVLTRPELTLRLGGRRRLDRALAEGGWQRVMQGAYVPAGVTITLAVRARAAQRLLPAHAYVADRCLLWLLGVDVLPPGPPLLEAVVPRGVVIPRRKGLVIREAMLPAGDRCRLDNKVRCLRPTRAVADLLRRLPLADAVVTADASQRARVCSDAELRQELVAHAKLRGVRQAFAVLDLCDPKAESPPESRVRLLLRQAGLAPVAQFDVGRRCRQVDRSSRPGLPVAQGRHRVRRTRGPRARGRLHPGPKAPERPRTRWLDRAALLGRGPAASAAHDRCAGVRGAAPRGGCVSQARRTV